MSWTRYLELVVLVNTQRRSPIATSLLNPNPLEQVEVVSHDKFPLLLRFAELTGNSNQPIRAVRLAVGSAIILAGKPVQDLASDQLLYYSSGFEEVEEPGVGEAPSTYYYEAMLNTHTQQIGDAIAALTGSNRIFQTLADIEVRTAENAQRTTFQFALNIRRQAFNGNETLPVDTNPPADE